MPDSAFIKISSVNRNHGLMKCVEGEQHLAHDIVRGALRRKSVVETDCILVEVPHLACVISK